MKWLLGSILLAYGSAYAGDPAIEVALLPESPALESHATATGQSQDAQRLSPLGTLNYSISLTTDPGVEITLPDIVEYFEKMDIEAAPKPVAVTESNGKLVTTHSYTLSVPADRALKEEDEVLDIAPGALSAGASSEDIPPIALRIGKPTAAEIAAATRALTVEPEPLDAPRSYAGWGLAGIAAIGGALLAFFAARLRRTRRDSGDANPAEMRREPWVVALEELDSLEARKLPDAGAWEEYYVHLSGILRRYIENRFHVRAPELTTQEFVVAAAAASVLTDPQQKLLASFLSHSDRVKFARHVPRLDDMKADMFHAREFVYDSIPAAAVETGGAAA